MINEKGIQPGVYELVIESYDALSRAPNPNALKTDSIIIRIIANDSEPTEPIEPTETTVILPSFKDDLPLQVIEIGKFSSWTLPDIVEGTYPLARIDFSADHQLASYLIFEPTSLTITFEGQKINDGLDLVDKVFFVEIKLFDENQNFVHNIQALQIRQQQQQPD